MAAKRTHEQFLEKLGLKNEAYRNGEFEVVGEYKNMKTVLLIKIGDFEYNIIPKRLLENKLPSFKQCIDKQGLFMQRLKENNRKVFDKIKSVVLFKSSNMYSIFNTDYGQIKTKYYSLERVDDLSIDMAMDKTEFWVKRNKHIREDFDGIDYSKVNYIDNSNKVKLRCKIHDYDYSQRPSHHTAGCQGCVYCMKQVIMYTKENFKTHKKFFKNHHSYFYVLRLSSDTELFYKVGITGGDRLEYRTNQLKKYYNVDVEYITKGLSSEQYDLEQSFLNKFKRYKYNPNKKFTGYTECLTVNPVDAYYDWYYN